MARKHFTQFTETERAFAYGFIRHHVADIGGARSHFYDRASERTFTLGDAIAAIRTGKVIEIHNDRGEWRALLRDSLGTCCVLSLETLQVVTVYYNAPDDLHPTLNHALYHGGNQVDIVATVKILAPRFRKKEN